MQSCFLRYSNSLVIQNFFWQRQSGCDSRSRPTGATATRCAGVKRLHQRNQRFLPNKDRGTLTHHLPNQTKSKLQTPAPNKKVPDAASAKKHCTYPLPARIMAGNTAAANLRQTFPLLHKGQRKNPENPHQIPSNHFFLIPNTSYPYTAHSASFQRMINSSH